MGNIDTHIINMADEVSCISLAKDDPLYPATSLSDVPLGTIIPWVPEANLLLTGSGLPEQSTQSELPDGWVHCDGSVIPEPSPWHGTTTPNLNEEQCFLLPPGNEDPQKLVEKRIETDSSFKNNQAVTPTSSLSSSGSSLNIS